ncbi:hypothetical protein DY218_27420 [Streptomyces triticagri]|uniref:Uncharacterized protein n=1 Tax=Streptomyces triticagri TaxID=2293568 RepID=A0A372LZ47_9ACTN|nr:hypothetical protein [Streptomyces triticagri]RFU83640.1 hypothetical protein DY218_27420 [Streptomyces triticagri]
MHATTVHPSTPESRKPRRDHADDCCTPPKIRPGSRVTYFGSKTIEHGRTFRAYACYCWRCWDLPDLRYRLIDLHADDADRDDYVIRCVRRTSITRH